MKAKMGFACVMFCLIMGPTASGGEPADLSAENQGLNFKTFTCQDFLEVAAESPQLAQLIVVWSQGYQSGRKGVDTNDPFGYEDIRELTDDIIEICSENEGKLFHKTIKKLK